MVHIENLYFQPDEITKNYVETGFKKSGLLVYQMLLLGILGGAFIALAAQGSNAAIHTLESIGVAKALAGLLFTAGLMMVIITGAELFTGNMLIVVSCFDGRTKWSGLIRNWFFVYTGNFIGSMLIVLFVILSGQFNFSDGLLGAFTIKTASYKIKLPFGNAFFMGLLCNCLVCISVWMASAAKDVTGKLLAVFFPVWLFIASGFEHSIANMYYIPAGILAKATPAWANAAITSGMTQEMLDTLNWYTFFVKNLIPVTLGNITGGTIFVGAIYWLSFLYKPKKNTDIKISANIKEVVYDNQK